MITRCQKVETGFTFITAKWKVLYLSFPGRNFSLKKGQSRSSVVVTVSVTQQQKISPSPPCCSFQHTHQIHLPIVDVQLMLNTQNIWSHGHIWQLENQPPAVQSGSCMLGTGMYNSKRSEHTCKPEAGVRVSLCHLMSHRLLETFSSGTRHCGHFPTQQNS